ncbi:ATP-binding protein [Oceanithermus sp.]
MTTETALSDCPAESSLASLSRVAAAMAATLEPNEVLARGVESLIEATGAVCGEAYLLTESGPELQVLHGCEGACPFKQQLAEMATRAAERGEPVRRRNLIALPITRKGRVHAVYGLSLPADAPAPDGCFLNAVCHLTTLALDHAELMQELERREAQRVRLLRKWLGAQEEERRRVGQALHDEVGGVLTGALLALRLAEKDPQRLEDVRTVLGRALDEVRRLSRELRPAALDDLGLGRALERHLREFERHTGIKTTAAINPPRLNQPAQAALFRIAQEALTNVARHSGAGKVAVRLEPDGEKLVLEISDDGHGFTPASGGDSLGLAGMRERAEQLDGEFSITSSPGAGCTVRVEVPLARVVD